MKNGFIFFFLFNLLQFISLGLNADEGQVTRDRPRSAADGRGERQEEKKPKTEKMGSKIRKQKENEEEENENVYNFQRRPQTVILSPLIYSPEGKT